MAYALNDKQLGAWRVTRENPDQRKASVNCFSSSAGLTWIALTLSIGIRKTRTSGNYLQDGCHPRLLQK